MAISGPRPEGPDEILAAAIVRAVTGCRTQRLDPGGGANRLADYMLLDLEGREIGLLEVTTSTDPRREQFWSANLQRHRSWQDPHLEYLWIARVTDAGVALKPLRGLLSPVLWDLERAGARFACSSSFMYSEHVEMLPKDVIDAGVVQAEACFERGPGKGCVALNIMSGGGFYGIESLTAAMEALVRVPDNLAKLASGARRELFVWFNPHSAALSALTTFSDAPHRAAVATARPPVLPPEVTAVGRRLAARPLRAPGACAVACR